MTTTATSENGLYVDCSTEEFLAKAQQVCERAGVKPDSLAVLPFLG